MLVMVPALQPNAASYKNRTKVAGYRCYAII